MTKLHDLESQKSSKFDYLIVGAGSTGCVVASRLAENFPDKVIGLVEAGTKATHLDVRVPAACGNLHGTDVDWQYVSEPSSKALQGMVNKSSKWPRGKCLGGSSCINYSAYVRGSSKDYQVWESQFKCLNWGWKSILPHFIKSECNDNLRNSLELNGLVLDEKSHGTEGPVGVSSNPTPGLIPDAFVDGCVAAGFKVGDYNRGEMEGVTSLFQQTISNGVRSDVASSFLYAKKRQYPNLKVIVNAHAARVLFDGTKATGVEFIDLRTKKSVALQANEVIVSCGAVGSPQLLKLSGIGPKSELQKHDIQCVVDNPHVGDHLEDHLVTILYLDAHDNLDIGATNTLRAERLPWALVALFKWLFSGKGMLATSSYDATAFFSTAEWKKTNPNWGPDGQIAILSTPGNDKLIENIGVAAEHNMWADKYSAKDAQAALMTPTLLHCHSKGTVTLKSKDPLDKPSIKTNYLEDQRDLNRFVEIAKKCMEIVETAPMKKLYKGIVFPETLLAKHEHKKTDAFWEDYLRSYGATIYHPSTTCRMGDVVDPSSLRVFETDGLRVADASVFPTMVSGNPNAVCIMTGEKLVNDIVNGTGL